MESRRRRGCKACPVRRRGLRPDRCSSSPRRVPPARGERSRGAAVGSATADERRISLRPAPGLTVYSGEVMPGKGDPRRARIGHHLVARQRADLSVDQPGSGPETAQGEPEGRNQFDFTLKSIAGVLEGSTLIYFEVIGVGILY